MWWPDSLPDSPTVADLQALEARLRQRVEQLTAQGAAVKAAADSARATVRKNDAVSVTVGMGGALEAITFLPKSSGLSPAMLASTVMAAYRQAVVEASHVAQQQVAEVAGADSPYVGIIRDATPSFEDAPS